jgi:hypothetical protein
MMIRPGHEVQQIDRKPGSTRFARRILYGAVLFFAAAAAFNGFYTKIGFREGDPARGFEAIIDGSAARPYVFRQLIPLIANATARAVPPGFQRRVATLHSDDGKGFYESLFSSPAALNPDYSFRYLIFYLAVLAGAIFAAFSFYLACRVEGHNPEVSLIAATLMILLIPYIETRGGGYYADFPEAAFIALAVATARRVHWLWLAPVAMAGTLNKETFILVVVALWPILAQRSSRLIAAVQVAVIEFVAVGVYLLNRLRFAANPGGTVEFHLKDQIAYLAHPGMWLFKFGKAYGVFLPELATVAPALLLGWVIWRSWKHISPAIRQYGLLLAGMNVPLFLLFCMPGEVRDLSLLYTIVLLAIAATLTQALRSGNGGTVSSVGKPEIGNPASLETVRSGS